MEQSGVRDKAWYLDKKLLVSRAPHRKVTYSTSVPPPTHIYSSHHLY